MILQITLVIFLAICVTTISCSNKDTDTLGNCTKTEFPCRNGKCIPMQRKCDGIVNCAGDQSDELNCYGVICSSDEFRCTNGRCIPSGWKCDKEIDCTDGSDELNCLRAECYSSQFRCTSGECIDVNSRCDGVTDCGKDQSDELNCSTEACKGFLCGNKMCIRASYKCDSEYDCGREDQSDEWNCANATCGTDEFRCGNGQCIPAHRMCDGKNSCIDKSDEWNCANATCEFRCSSGHCISLHDKCDGVYSCLDKSDELDCTARLDFLVKAKSMKIKVPNHGAATWAIDVRSNPQNFTIRWRHNNTKARQIQFGTEKYKIFRIQSTDFLTELLVQIIKVTHEDTGIHSLEFILEGTNTKVVNFRLTVEAEHDAIGSPTEMNVVINPIRPWFVHTNLQNLTVTKIPGENVELICHVSGSPKPQIAWTWKNQDTSKWWSFFNYSLSEDNTFLFLQYISKNVEGKFECTASNQLGNKTEFVEIVVPDYVKPYFQETDLKNWTKILKKGEFLELRCMAAGIPEPNVAWTFKNNLTLNPVPDTNWSFSLLDYSLYKGKQVLLLKNVSFSVNGRFTCTAGNRHGKILEYIDISVNEANATCGTGTCVNEKPDAVVIVSPGKPVPSHLWVILGIVSSGAIVLILCAFFMWYKYRQRKLYGFRLSEKEFYEGNVENISADMNATDQAHLLPFQQTTWEIPRNCLKLGATLGSGAFGQVLKAQAFGVVEGEQSSTVAVKMVKQNADDSHFKALMTELKIMAHLGRNLNIVNLVGAVTINLAKKRELLVVMEFCKYGSVLSYMQRNRRSFINQLNPSTDSIDPSFSPPVDETANRKQQQQRNQTNSYGDQIEGSDGCSLDIYQGDYQVQEVQSIKSTDLLSWAFQAAKGMEYLSSRKVLHGDLAARNVLLAENSIVKICDFGYARETFKNYDYKKDTKGVLLPIKWMAIESIYCGLFSSKSDCWSFGVFLWELFTLGNKPYPGMEVNQDFCQQLDDGYRMDKPRYAPTSVYRIMTDCWAHEPSDRPTFSELANKLGDLISNWVRNQIIELNEDYTCANQQARHSSAGGADFLMQMGHADLCVGEADESNSASNLLRYQETPTSTLETEPACSVSTRNSQCRFFKDRPQPPPRKMI